VSGLTGPSLQGPGRQNDPTDYADLAAAIRRQDERLAELERGAQLRAAGIIARPGSIASTDYDGTDRTHLGTAGYFLGSPDGGPTYLALNGVNVKDDLDAKDVVILDLIDELIDAQDDLAAQAAYQASLISRDASVGVFNTGTMTNDSADHFFGPQAVITSLPIPTGKVRITLSSSEVSISPGSNGVVVAISYAIDGVSVLDGSRYARLYTFAHPVGVSLARVSTETLAPGTYTIRSQASYWSSGSTTASASVAGIRLLAEVIGSG
jgi:hypothetical protein